jgi:hypothetical protein
MLRSYWASRQIIEHSTQGQTTHVQNPNMNGALKSDCLVGTWNDNPPFLVDLGYLSELFVAYILRDYSDKM